MLKASAELQNMANLREKINPGALNGIYNDVKSDHWFESATIAIDCIDRLNDEMATNANLVADKKLQKAWLEFSFTILGFLSLIPLLFLTNFCIVRGISRPQFGGMVLCCRPQQPLHLPKPPQNCLCYFFLFFW